MKIDWEKDGGLVPAIVQDATDGRVLMLGYMNEEALRATEKTRRVTFFSRSKQRLWVKGETSGNFLELRQIRRDCDNDALLVTAVPCGPVCHNGTATCFDGNSGMGFLGELEEIIASRLTSDEDGGKSYVASLRRDGAARMAQKVGEEGVEVALAAAVSDKVRLREESADLLFHLMVLLRHSGLSLADVAKTLSARHDAAEK